VGSSAGFFAFPKALKLYPRITSLFYIGQEADPMQHLLPGSPIMGIDRHIEANTGGI
jgi:hypothetical protein